MKIAVIGANGKAGRLIVSEAVRRGAEVTAVVRSDNRSETPHVIQKDIMDLTKADLKDFDVVVNAFGVWDPDKMGPQYSIKSFEQSFEWKQYTSSRSRRSRQFVY